jgi:hypothetical protein
MIRITRHARNRMRRHRISEEIIHMTLLAPEWEEQSLSLAESPAGKDG